MNEPSDREERLFTLALEITDPAKREEFLTVACGDDTALRQRIERLLALQTNADEVFPTEPSDRTELSPGLELGEGAGSQIGKYKLLQVIGEGGMGVVYFAAEEGALQRKVAFKIIKLGMDTKSVVARFEAERQALALMDHRNIAKVFDAGATDTGRPFFVMELVKGIPITEYCDKHKLTVEQRLELFIPVCEAIQHAHHKGIIHRDIKPSNVMVAHFDGKPVPMVIDFGIAKATHQRLTEKTQWTEFGQFIGTPAYVSPEQAEGSQLDIDTRSDLYSLGVLLYELLTGSTPFPDKRLRSAGWKEMQRIILEDEPDKPSTRLSTLSEEERTTLNKAHPEGLGRISLLLRRELDWVVMKCLEKDRNRRYETASQLAQEIANYLKGEALIAMPPSGWYRFSKLARKHKKTFAMAAAIAVILAVATVISTYQSVVAKRERDVAQAVSDFLDKDLLQRADVYGSDPFQTPHRDLKLLEVVNRASTNLQGKFTNQPVVEASIRLTLGKIFIGLGEPLLAEEHLEKSLALFKRTLGDSDLRTAEAAYNLGRIQTIGFKLINAETNLTHALRIRRQLLVPHHPDVFDTRHELAVVAHNQGDTDRWGEILESAFREAQDHLKADDEIRLRIEDSYVWELGTTGRGSNALALAEDVHNRVVGKYGSNNVRALSIDHARAWLAGWYEGNWEKSNALWMDIVDRGELSMGNPLEYFEPLARAGFSLKMKGLSSEGRSMIMRAHETVLAKAGTNHPMAYGSKMMVVFTESPYLTPTELIRNCQEVLAGFDRVGATGGNYGSILPELQHAYWRAGEATKVLETARHTLIHQRRFFTPKSDWYYGPIRDMIRWPSRLAHWDEAADHCAILLPLPRRTTDDPLSAAVVLAVAGRTNEALDAMRDRLKEFTPNTNELDTVLMAAFVLNALPAATNAALLNQPLGSNPAAPELIAHGLARFRAGDFARAAEQLRPIVEHSPNPHLAILAGDYLSLALQRAGDTTQAARVLEAANAQLERVLRCGDTGESQWLWAALCLLARREAELGVFGEARSVPVAGAYITRMREQWKPVHQLLEAGLQHCRHSRWPEARAAFLGAIRHPAFSWEAGEVEVANLRFLMALTFKRAGDEANYLALCEPPPPDEFLAPLNHLTVSLDFQKPADRVLVYDYSKMFQSEENMGGPEWQAMLRAFADYAADRELERVVTVSAAAAEKCYHWGRQTVGLALGAATHSKLDRNERARELLAQAEAKLRELDENNQPDRAWHWPELTLCELALEEARRQVGEGTVAASK